MNTQSIKVKSLTMASEIRLPSALIAAVQEQRAVLFLGAGASIGARHPKGEQIPGGNALRDKICDKFLDGDLKNRPLIAVAAMVASEVGLIQFQKYIREVFLDFNPSKTHLLVPTFRWRAIATTNFDLVIERAYEKSRGAVQNLVKSWKDGDLFDTRQREISDPVGLYKLHGCIEHYTDATIPFILGLEQYASYSAHRKRFYLRLQELAYDNPIIFCGYSISDPHIQQFLFDLTDKSISRPVYNNIDPSLKDIEVRYWAGNQVTCLPINFEKFLEIIDGKISTNARKLTTKAPEGQSSLFPHFRSNEALESADLRYFLQHDVIHLHNGLTPLRQDPKDFYKGYDTGFGCIQQELDVPRLVSDSILVDSILAEESQRRNGELYLIKGPAGNGKTVALKRVAWEAATTYGNIVLYVNGSSGIRFEPLEEIHQLTGKRIFLFIDRVALFREQIATILKYCRERRFPLTIVGAERENEWFIYCDELEKYCVQEFPIAYLNKSEIEKLLGKLEEHGALGFLQEKSHGERVDSFSNRAEGQLLVALHEVTLGVPFETIILDEYNRIRPAEARRIYLQICALHQFGASVRAGLISRASGTNFKEFGSQFLKPLSDVVLMEESRHGDVYYRSRHGHVAEVVFNQVLTTDEQRYDVLHHLLYSMNIEFSSDREHLPD